MFNKKCHNGLLMLILTISANQVFAKDIEVGMSTALSGPAKALGINVKLGVESYFKRVNDNGGVHGNKVKLVALDDGYEPNKAAPNMRKLIDEKGVVAVIGNVGTPTAIVTVPIANEKNTLLFGAYSGAGVLRKSPTDRYVINYRASYAQETAAMVDGLIAAGIKPTEIAFFTQNDGYGDAGYNGAIKALKKHGYSATEQLAHGRYTRNTSNVEDGLITILDAEVEPKAIIMVGAYMPCAKFIELAKQDLPEALFLNVSFVGSVALKTALGAENSEGVIITQVVPHYNNGKLSAVKDYQQDMKNYDSGATFGFASLEGYLAAKVLVEGMKKSGKDLNSESIITGLEALTSLDIGIGTTLSYSEKQHQASHKVWPTVIKNGDFVSFEWHELSLN
ncbi:MAG: ABC transporter substrate-binding protein [Cognaticolwellia sp.]